jgi:hypothetical protein
VTGGFAHETAYEGETNDWITPKWVIDAFNSRAQDRCYFDLDPCMSITQPWPTARQGFTVEQDGLLQKWSGNVWCNPPYGPHAAKWMRRMAEHGNGIALIFARLETELWQDYIFTTANGFLFPRKRIGFARPDGTMTTSSGAPSAFVAWGEKNREALIALCDGRLIDGAFFDRALYFSRRIEATQSQTVMPL